MNADQVRAIIRKQCDKAGSQKAWAKQHRLNEVFVSQVLRGDREPSPAILELLGLKRVVEYRRSRSAD